MIDSKEKQNEVEKLRKNPAYNHVQPKLYTSTVANDMKSFNNNT